MLCIVRQKPREHGPIGGRVVHLGQMCDLMSGYIVKNLRRGEHQPPRQHDIALAAARAPARARIAEAEPPVPPTQIARMKIQRSNSAVPRLSLHPCF